MWQENESHCCKNVKSNTNFETTKFAYDVDYIRQNLHVFKFGHEISFLCFNANVFNLLITHIILGTINVK